MANRGARVWATNVNMVRFEAAVREGLTKPALPDDGQRGHGQRRGLDRRATPGADRAEMTARRRRIYIAGPISKGDVQANVQRGIRMTHRDVDGG